MGFGKILYIMSGGEYLSTCPPGHHRWENEIPERVLRTRSEISQSILPRGQHGLFPFTHNGCTGVRFLWWVLNKLTGVLDAKINPKGMGVKL